MTDSEATPRTVTLTRVFDAPIGLVYRAWTEAEHVTKWMKCDVEVTLEVDNWVPEVGNQFSTHMAQPGAWETRGTGRFTEVDPPHVLAYVTDADPKLGVPEMNVRVELKDVEGKTEITLTHSGIPNDMICDVIQGGWTSSMKQLEPVLGELLRATDTAGARP